MQEQSKQRQPVRPRKRWVINAIAAPALLWMMWGGLLSADCSRMVTSLPAKLWFNFTVLACSVIWG